MRATLGQSDRRATAISEPPRTQDNCLSGASARIDERNSTLSGSGGTVSVCLTISIVSLDGARRRGAIQR